MQARSSYDQQLAIEAYWRGVDPLTFLPGSINAADRFARVSFLINAIPGKRDPSTIKAVPGATYEKSGGGQRAERHAFHSECRWASPTDEAQHLIYLVAHRLELRKTWSSGSISPPVQTLSGF